jgi:hypothetical protein
LLKVSSTANWVGAAPTGLAGALAAATPRGSTNVMAKEAKMILRMESCAFLGGAAIAPVSLSRPAQRIPRRSDQAHKRGLNASCTVELKEWIK